MNITFISNVLEHIHDHDEMCVTFFVADTVLEEDSPALTSATNLSQLLPFILHNEIEKLKGEVQGRPVSILFDGTTHACEAMVILLRFVDDQWIIQQRVCSLKLLAKSLRGEEVAQQIVSIILQELGIQSSLVVAASRDRAAVNNVAMRTVKVVYSSLLDIGCFSHTLDHVGERVNTPQLDMFFKAWISLFAHSPKARPGFSGEQKLGLLHRLIPQQGGGAAMR